MENPNQNSENLNALIAKRPFVFSNLFLQRALLIVFLLGGITFVVIGIYDVFVTAIKIAFADELTNEIVKDHPSLESKKELVRQACEKFMHTQHLRSVFKTIFLGIALLILARYCQKVLNRNKYIMKLEKAVTEI